MTPAKFTKASRLSATRELFNETAQPGALALALKGYTAPPEHITYEMVELAVVMADCFLAKVLIHNRLRSLL